MGVDTFPTYAEGKNLNEWRGSLKRYSGTIPRINPLVLLDVDRAQRRVNRLSKQVPLDRPWEAAKAREWDSMTAQAWMDRHMRTKSGRELLQLGIESVWAAQPEDISLLHLLFYVHSAGSLELLFDTEGGAQDSRFVGGSQARADRAGEAARGRGGAHGAPGAPDRARRRRRDDPRGRRHRARQARDRDRAARAGGPDRLRPADARPPRPAHPADAARDRGEVHGHLRRAVLARRGAERPGDQRRRPREAHLRQLAAGRLAGRAARLPRGSARPRDGPGGAGGAPGAR